MACGKCGESGHNGRTCQTKASITPLQALLEARGIAPADAAKAIGHSHGSFYDGIRGRTTMSEAALRKLAKFLKARPRDVIIAFRLGRLKYTQEVAAKLRPMLAGQAGGKVN